MSKPASRISDQHTCPIVEPKPPHVGGPIITPSAPNVLIGGLPAAGVGSTAICNGPSDSVVLGSFTVLVGGRPQARIADSTAHGGIIVVGCPTVLVGG